MPSDDMPNVVAQEYSALFKEVEKYLVASSSTVVWLRTILLMSSSMN
jgi:DNA-binding ferritin-like protein (Dps family)